MPYKFTFDLSKVPRFFFTEIAVISYHKGMHKTLLNTLQEIIRKFRIQEATGLNISDAVVLLQDLIEMQAINLLERGRFLQTKKRALFLPHCARKFMDNRCKANFDPSIPSYTCAHCSTDCLVNKADTLARKKGYDVYILPGGSCVPKILKNAQYEGVVGVACGEEVKISKELLTSMDVAAQAIPLIKNGCANTIFNMDTLVNTL
ncbi:DUF116 domain-containing protein [Candidatus Bathyarchaeota archaeon A05DMB-2]|jgi:hypothetical protein|nr:DUF116 domain-containing protein [Candidatus Bathyarchaeota archaeon A05DMB-2]MDH7564837.1 DUF116 domain-containing protein [Candidatus Bathyarchaeota archaeon]